MKIDILPDADGLEDEWWNLWQRDPAATVFQTPAWLLPWRRHFDAGENRILAIRREGRLIGLVPLFRYEGRLLPWGAGTTDWLDGVFDPDLCAAELSQGLAELAEPLDFFQLHSGSLLLRASLPTGWTEQCGPSEVCLVLSLPARVPPHMAQNLRYYRRRAARAGIGEPERAKPGAFEDLAELHSRRWNERGEPGVLCDPRVLQWHRETLPALEAVGLLRLYVLRLHRRTVAALYGLHSKHRTFYYIGGFEPEFSALGLGTILVGYAIAAAEQEKAKSFDFLRGQEAYKYRWGATDQPTYARLLCPPRR